MNVKSAPLLSRRNTKVRKRTMAISITAGCFAVLVSSASAIFLLSHSVSTPAPSVQQCNSRFDQRTLAQVKAYASSEDCAKSQRAFEAHSNKDIGACTSLRTKADLILANATNELLRCYREAALSGNVTRLSKAASFPSEQYAMSLLTTKSVQKSPTEARTEARKETFATLTEAPRHPAAVKKRQAHHGLAHLSAHLTPTSKPTGDILKADRFSDLSLAKMAVFAGVNDDAESWLDGHWPPISIMQTGAAEESAMSIADRINGVRSALPSQMAPFPVVIATEQVADSTQPDDAEIRLDSASVFAESAPLITSILSESVQNQPEPAESEQNAKGTALSAQTRAQPTTPLKVVTPAQQLDTTKATPAPKSTISTLSDDSTHPRLATTSIKINSLQCFKWNNSTQSAADAATSAPKPFLIANEPKPSNATDAASFCEARNGCLGVNKALEVTTAGRVFRDLFTS